MDARLQKVQESLIKGIIPIARLTGPPWKGRANPFSRRTLERLIQIGALDSLCHT